MAQTSIPSDDPFLQDNPTDVNPVEDMKDNDALPGEEATPFSEPGAQNDIAAPGHEDSDSGIDPHEAYDEPTGQAQQTPPEPGNAVNDFDPDKV